MSNWCMGCGKMISDGDYCTACERPAHYPEFLPVDDDCDYDAIAPLPVSATKDDWDRWMDSYDN